MEIIIGIVCNAIDLLLSKPRAQRPFLLSVCKVLWHVTELCAICEKAMFTGQLSRCCDHEVCMPVNNPT